MKRRSGSNPIPRLTVQLPERSDPAAKGRRLRWLAGSLLLLVLLSAAAILLWRPGRVSQPAGGERTVGTQKSSEVPKSAIEVAGREPTTNTDFAGRGSGFNVLLITLDTTRADHLRCYGHKSIETPHIDALAAEGVTFTQCTSAAPITLPSHASIMTGTYPYVHGVRDNVQFQLSESNVTLAELLKRSGYSTAAQVGAYVLKHDFGLAQGFDTYIDPGHEHERRADAVTAGAIDWLRRHSTERFFLWAHFFDPHAPYEPPEPFRGRYDDPYDAEIAYTDQQIGVLLAELDELGIRERTLVVLTADHGEGRGEHDEETHLFFVYDTTLHVPLIFHCPGQIPAGRRIVDQVRLIDVVPTVLAFLELPMKDDAQGENLLPLLLGESDSLGLAAYSESLGGYLAMGLSPLRSLRVGGWKYIHGPKPELFHVAEDPGETNNLAAKEPQRMDGMADRLRSLIAAAPPPPMDDTTYRPTGIDNQRLMSLGYVGGGRNSAPSGLPARELDLFEPAGPDPKDHTRAIEMQGEATHATLERDFARAERLLREVRREFSDSPGVAARLARVLFQQGKDDEAIAIYRNIVARHPDYAEALYGLAKLHSRNRRTDEAIAYLRKTIEADRDFAEAHYDLGVLLGRAGNLDESITCYRAALRIRPTYVNALINLAVGLVQKEQFEEGIRLYRRAIKLEPEDPTIHYNLGNALVRRGDLREAAQSYEAALRLNPNFAPAQASLRGVRRELDRNR